MPAEAILHARLLEMAFRLHSEPGREPASVGDIAHAVGLSGKWVRHWYHDLETIQRLATQRKIAELALPLAWSPPETARPREAILHYAGICGRLFASDDYRRLAFLLMRDGTASPWLVKAHEREIVEAARAGLARIVAEARTAGGTRLDLRASGARAFVLCLQSQLTLPMLLPGAQRPTITQVRALTARAADEALKSIYAAGTFAEGLGRLQESAETFGDSHLAA